MAAQPLREVALVWDRSVAAALFRLCAGAADGFAVGSPRVAAAFARLAGETGTSFEGLPLVTLAI